MADRSNVFPVYIRAEYDGEDPFPVFLRHVENTANEAKRKFGSAFQDIERTVSAALDKPLTARGALDLNPERFRAAADGAKRQALALREVADAAERLAQSDPSVVLRRQAAEAANAALAAEKYSQSVAEQALALDRLQGELGQTKTATSGLASAQKGYQGSIQASRAATVQAGQQLQDLVISIGSGQRASTVFAQQLPQLAFALSETGGTVGKVARFFAGPWGIALAAGSFALGPLIDRLFQTATAADEVKFATNAMGEAQGILGNVMDITTGKIGSQSEALMGLAKAQLLVARVNAQTRAAEAKRGVQDIQSRGLEFSGGIGGGFSVRRRPTDARDVISKGVLDGTLNASTAVERLENLRRVGRLTDDQFASAAASVANLGVELENLKVFDDAQKLLAGTGGRNLLKPSKAKKTGSRKGDGGAARLAEFGEDAASKIASITDRFGEASSAAQAVNQALRQLADLESDIQRRKPANIDLLLSQLKDARGIVEASLSKPFRDMLETAREQEEIDQRLIDGREIEAEVLQRALGFREKNSTLSQRDAETIAEIVVQERLRKIEIEKQTEAQRRQLDLIESTQSNLRETVNELFRGKGFGAIGNLFERQFDGYIDSLSDQISDALFGDVFREQKLKLLGLDKVDEAGKAMAANVLATSNELDRLKIAAGGAANALMAANDNRAFPDAGFGANAADIATARAGINVTANKPITTRDLVKALGKEVFGEKLADRLSDGIEKALQGVAYGQVGGGLVSSLGVRTSRTGSQVGGALGEAAFKKLAPELFKKLGDFAGPLGSIAGGILGGVIGGLFKKTPKGNVQITQASVSASGSKSLTGNLGKAGNAIQDRIAAIAESLGGDVGSYSASIRQKGKKFYVGGQKFSDIESAGEEALRQAIINGAVQGIHSGAQRLLQAGSDLDRQLSKAVKFQSIFDRLKEAEDPAGFALEKLNREFASLKTIAQEAGEGLVELERLYGLERAKVIEETTERLSGSLRSLIDDLKTGENGLSLRSRLANARAIFDPLANTIRSGGTVDADKFAEISRTVLDLQRQIDGSQTGYFDALNDILGLSETALARQQASLLSLSARSSPFTAALPSNDTVPVVNAINSQTRDLIAAINAGTAVMLAMNDNIANVALYQGRAVSGDGRVALGANLY